MAARMLKMHQEHVKQKIKGSQLINRLQNHALAELEFDENGNVIKGKGYMTASQIQATKILLDKIISNAPTDVKANITGSVIVQASKHDESI